MEWKYGNGKMQGVDEDGNLLSEVTFTEDNKGTININHVYVIPKLRGQGFASETMEAMSLYLRDKKLKATATCSYAITWFKRNKDKYADVISDELLFTAPIACSIKGKH